MPPTTELLPGHLGAVRFGDLDCKGADAAGSAIDQHPLPGLDFSVVAKALECGYRCHRNCSRFLKRQVAGFKDGFSTSAIRSISGGPYFSEMNAFISGAPRFRWRRPL